jgi:multidrug resistance efflux pump
VNPTRPARRWWLVALALLVVSLAGFGHVLSVTLRGAPATETPERPAVRTVVCFGFVDLVNGVRELNPTVPGRVAEVLVREGETVPAGAVLLRMEDTVARKRVDEAQAALDAAKAELAEGRSLPEQHRINVEQARAAVKAAEAQRNAKDEALTRMKELERKGVLPNRSELLIAQEDQKAAQELLRIKEADLRSLSLRDPGTAVRLLEIKVTRAEALLEQAKAALADYVLTAPKAGTVLRIAVGRGDTLAGPTRQAAVQFCPDEPRIIRAEVEQAFASQIAEGQSAKIEDDTHAAGSWTGKVQHVADWFTQKRSMMPDPMQYNDVRMLECIVTLDPGQPRLRLGQRVRVFIQVPAR